jgi:hypothetical protein
LCAEVVYYFLNLVLIYILQKYFGGRTEITGGNV